MKNFKNIFLATLVVLAVIVVLQNTEAVETRVLFVTITMPRALLLLTTLLVGVASGLVLGTRIGARNAKDAA